MLRAVLRERGNSRIFSAFSEWIGISNFAVGAARLYIVDFAVGAARLLYILIYSHSRRPPSGEQVCERAGF